jgi:hypothetical protein
MWSGLLERSTRERQDTVQLLLVENQHVIQALSSNTAQKAFTDRLGTRGVIGRLEYLAATRCCQASETGTTIALLSANEVLRPHTISSGLPQLVCGPSVGGKAVLAT